jgi:hypothetical protein
MVSGFQARFQNPRGFLELRNRAELSLALLEVLLSTLRANMWFGEEDK